MEQELIATLGLVGLAFLSIFVVVALAVGSMSIIDTLRIVISSRRKPDIIVEENNQRIKQKDYQVLEKKARVAEKYFKLNEAAKHDLVKAGKKINSLEKKVEILQKELNGFIKKTLPSPDTAEKEEIEEIDIFKV